MKIRQCFLELQLKMSGMFFFETHCRTGKGHKKEKDIESGKRRGQAKGRRKEGNEERKGKERDI